MNPNQDHTDAALSAAHADVKAEISRTDSKSSLLLAFAGALLAGAVSVATNVTLPTEAAAVGVLGVIALAAAAGLLLRTVRPNLSGRVGMPKWATLAPGEIRADLAQDQRAEHIQALARIAVAKFGNLRRAIDLICLAGVLFGITAAIALGGAS
ncbi:Pycsar system effector family protein [Streptomyces sp. HNM0574]|uniref:Pycsar system effector family protein n=1 Tax=Streptomyces sp. HNM0574 TaxID=2714954 RepID=UPI00146C6DB8|nr:Pycsar system effector family protein [Streptomyces sp. HNM0574]NLU68480.1 integral membrane plasmid transfer protein [Streptomyces sp. HNM0574]